MTQLTGWIRSISNRSRRSERTWQLRCRSPCAGSASTRTCGWTSERTCRGPTTKNEPLSWLESRYDVPDLHVIRQRTESCIEERQQLAHGPNPIEAVRVTGMQAVLRLLAALALQRERSTQKWTAEEDSVLAWLAAHYSIEDLHIILRRPMRRIEDRLIRLRIAHPGLELRLQAAAESEEDRRVLRWVLIIFGCLVVAGFVSGLPSRLWGE